MNKQQLEEHAGEEPRWIRKRSYFVIVFISGYLLLGGLGHVHWEILNQALK
jgi:hypothetical protein